MLNNLTLLSYIDIKFRSLVEFFYILFPDCISIFCFKTSIIGKPKVKLCLTVLYESY